MTNNVIDFTSHWTKREQTKNETEKDELEGLHEIITIVSNQAINDLRDEYGLDIDKVEFSPEIIFFFEAFKGLVMKAAGHWHPFQDFAEEFFSVYGIRIEEDPSGNYKFVIGENLDLESEQEPANDG